VPPPQQANTPGDYVRDLQADLNGLGYFAGHPDGWFGEDTLAAVRTFQRDTGSAPRQEQGNALADGRRFEETPPPYDEVSRRVRDLASTAGGSG
jgi:peptidoglycan hydrolase-like protein with peptidoglycan-binding domain